MAHSEAHEIFMTNKATLRKVITQGKFYMGLLIEVQYFIDVLEFLDFLEAT